MPATCGVDMDVPLRYWKKSPVEPSAGSGVMPARICTPGAVTSGLIQLGSVANGPREEKSAMMLPVIDSSRNVVGDSVALTVTAFADLGEQRAAHVAVDHDARNARASLASHHRP